MKHTESSFDSQILMRKFSKTPSTAYSYTESPMLGSSQSDILSRNLAMMQSQLAEKLKKQAYYLSLQVPVVQHKLELTDLRLEKVTNNSKTVKNVLHKFSKKFDPELRLKNVVCLEKSNESELKEIERLKGCLKVVGKKVKSTQMLNRRDIFLQEQCLLYEKEHKQMIEKKNELIENLHEISQCQKKILKIYSLSKSKLEHLILSKEELLLSIPYLSKPSTEYSSQKPQTSNILKKNQELKQILSSLTQELQVIQSSISQKRAESSKAIENFNSRNALINVQRRFLEEKKTRIEFVKKELDDIQKSAAKAINRSQSNEGLAKSGKSRILNRPPTASQKAINKSSYS